VHETRVVSQGTALPHRPVPARSRAGLSCPLHSSGTALPAFLVVHTNAVCFTRPSRPRQLGARTLLVDSAGLPSPISGVDSTEDERDSIDFPALCFGLTRPMMRNEERDSLTGSKADSTTATRACARCEGPPLGPCAFSLPLPFLRATRTSPSTHCHSRTLHSQPPPKPPCPATPPPSSLSPRRLLLSTLPPRPRCVRPLARSSLSLPLTRQIPTVTQLLVRAPQAHPVASRLVLLLDQASPVVRGRLPRGHGAQRSSRSPFGPGEHSLSRALTLEQS